MNNVNGVNSYPYYTTSLPNGIPNPVEDNPSLLDALIRENEDIKNSFDNLEESKKAEVLRNVKDFQSKEELERYLYHLENDEFR